METKGAVMDQPKKVRKSPKFEICCGEWQAVMFAAVAGKGVILGDDGLAMWPDDSFPASPFKPWAGFDWVLNFCPFCGSKLKCDKEIAQAACDWNDLPKS